MRFLVALIVGFCVGAAIACAALFYNPFSQFVGNPPAGTSYFYGNEQPDFAISHAGKLPVPIRPAGTQGLWESAINGAVLTVFPLTDGDGETVALASRISTLSEDSDLFLRGALTSNDWLISFPNLGTLYVDDRENLSAVLRHGVFPVWVFRQPWNGTQEMLATAGPDAGSAEIVGGNGDYENASGRIRQRYTVDRFGQDDVVWRTEIGLELDGAPEPIEAEND